MTTFDYLFCSTFTLKADLFFLKKEAFAKVCLLLIFLKQKLKTFLRVEVLLLLITTMLGVVWHG